MGPAARRNESGPLSFENAPGTSPGQVIKLQEPKKR